VELIQKFSLPEPRWASLVWIKSIYAYHAVWLDAAKLTLRWRWMAGQQTLCEFISASTSYVDTLSSDLRIIVEGRMILRQL